MNVASGWKEFNRERIVRWDRCAVRGRRVGG